MPPDACVGSNATPVEYFGEEVVAGTLDCLRGSPLFSGVPEAVVLEAAATFTLRRTRAGTSIEPGGACARDAGVYVVRGGTVRMEFRIAPDTALDCGELRRGDAFGLESLFAAAPGPSIRSAGSALVMYAPAERFANLAGSSPELMRNVARGLAATLAATSGALYGYRSIGLARRLLEILQETASRYGVTVADGILLDVALAPADLAALAGASEARVESALALLQREGAIRIDGPLIRLLSGR
jgi:CRP-like cAMP-binding protein